MKYRAKLFPLYVGSLSMISLALVAPSAMAQEPYGHDACRSIGIGAPQPLGDREGHTVLVANFSCETVKGGLTGVVWTGTITWEWDGPKAKEVSGEGFGRKPGTMNAYRDTDGMLELVMTDGKPTGWKGSGHAVNLLSTGDWAPMSNKTFSWTCLSTGLDTFECDWTIDK